MKQQITLAIETSCDETSVAVLEGGKKVLANMISSQIEDHRVFGGVVPEVASRLHLESINQMIEEALQTANISFSQIDVVAVTKGPGLIGALLVGISAAKSITLSLNIPLVGVNHMQGHICAAYLSHPELEPPFLSLVVSGGHTYLVDVKDHVDYHVLGRTMDDAAGESFDKVARALHLSYPGGPEIDRLAKNGNPNAIGFPRVMLSKDSMDFSFSGLKTAVLNYLNQKKQKNEPINREDVAADFQSAVVEVLVEKTLRAAAQCGYDKIVVTGGVASNSKLREELTKAAMEQGKTVYVPTGILCTDNAAMIGCAGYYQYRAGVVDDLGMKVYPNLEL